jgi:hypothetical protein
MKSALPYGPWAPTLPLLDFMQVIGRGTLYKDETDVSRMNQLADAFLRMLQVFDVGLSPSFRTHTQEILSLQKPPIDR